MDRGAVLLAGLRAKLEERRQVLERSTYGAVTIAARPNGEFSVKVTWPGGTYEKVFDRAFVFGTSARRIPVVQRRVCDHTREIISEVLAARGV